MAVGAAAPAAKTVALHFLSKQVYIRVSDASGRPLSPNTAGAAGDRLSIASNDYAGNHEHPARQATASDHIVCTLTSANTALCDGAMAIGGSMILGDDFALNFTSTAPATLKVTGGTGTYRHVNGTVVAKTVNSTLTDLTLKISY